MKIFKYNKALILTLVLPTLINAGDVTGTVKFNGKPPKAKKIRMDADPVCSMAHQEAAYSESFIMDADRNLANVIVYLKGIEYSGDAPSEPVILDQQGCTYTPHVIGLMAGQDIKILNNDATMHNIHGLPKKNKEFNFGMPKTLKEKTITFSIAEDAFVIKCDVHPWMKSFIQVFDHPYFAVTESDGSFMLKNVPAGTYKIMAWQEKFGSKKMLSQEITVGEKESSVNFTFERPKKK